MAVFLGADSSVAVSATLIDRAARYLGTQPAFWGRYFNGYHSTAAEYDPSEGAIFAENGLMLLPVAQQTPKVHGTADDGAQHAALNVEKFIERIGLEWLAGSGSEFIMFLDVEGEQNGSNPSLSPDYYTGWSTALVRESQNASGGRFVIRPAVYARTRDADTWKALADGEANGAEPCAAIWVTRQRVGACKQPVPAWSPKDARFLLPGTLPRAPIVCWQFAIDCPDGNGVDLNIVNPDADAQAALRDRLIVPQAR